MDLNSIYEVTQDGKTRWAHYAHGGDTYLTMCMLKSADILQTVDENLTDQDAFLNTLLRASKVDVQELDKSSYDALLKKFHNSKENSSVIHIDYDSGMCNW